MVFAKSAPNKIILFALTLQLLIVAVLVCPSRAGSAPAKDVTVEEAYPGLATGMLKLARLSDLGKGEILKTRDISITETSLNESLSKMGSAIQPQVTKHRFFLLEDYATKSILLQEAKKAGVAKNELEEQIIRKFHCCPK
jgi:hypothetical protein